SDRKQSYAYPWTEVAREVRALMERGEYISTEDIDTTVDNALYYLHEVSDDNTDYWEILEKCRKHPMLSDTSRQKIEAEIAETAKQTESSIHFGELGSGITCYDISHKDTQTGDYQTVAHISEEGILTWREIDYDLSDADENRIVEMADRQRDRFTEQWVKQSIESRYSAILNTAKMHQMSQIADEPLTMEEKVHKYEKSVIFKTEEFPFAEPTYQIYQIKTGEQYHGIRFQSLVENRDANLRVTDYDLVYTGNWNRIEGRTVRDKLENIYALFNSDQLPKNFKGHSLSMSDMVTVTENGQEAAYYVDSFGFADYPDFRKPKNSPEPLEIQGHDLTIDFTKTPFMMMQYRSEEYLGGMDANGHERRDNFGTEEKTLMLSSQNDGSVTIDSPNIQNWNLSPYIESDRQSIANEIKSFLDRADASSLRILGGISSTEMVDIPMTAAENAPETAAASAKEEQTGWRYYIIADMSTWSTNSGERSPIEMYSLDEAIKRFKELRDEAYNAEPVYGQDQDKPL
ncbi:MAG: hypothetical protein J6S92_00025, partial [Oscillospiraceae bacterium]|nr:hypothetical protein [Oscillospiraceae bacterium]